MRALSMRPLPFSKVALHLGGGFKVQTLLQQMQDKFQTMSDQIIGRIDDMSCRIDDLEKNIADLMTQAGVEELEGGENKAATTKTSSCQ
ncbi:heat shock factor-binding protein 1 isoform X1 [Protobothrops mucrosquamatus]|uniref:heat shock factor-binding protein 1 isoform X1 n=1 Tax=Protobothrops mucrosquamatus TaxID=103944 RepID=UPI00077566E4|nr:heat shock factor-binding protein 1 isoform X1 [Protobothrops mucrosquamatus]